MRHFRVYYPILFLLFLVSGFCGLLYQIVWLRLAFANFGIITPVLSVVVSVFMLGLGIGSWFGGKLIEHLTRRIQVSAIAFYAFVEFMIGIGGITVPEMFKIGERLLCGVGNFDSLEYLSFSAFILGISILPWCICMGATVPFMMAFIKEFNRDDRKGFSYLYLANVIGAMCGTAATTIFLIELLGLRNTLFVAASCNFCIAITAFLINFWHTHYKSERFIERDIIELTPTRFEGTSRPLLSCFILFTSGFISMAMEVVWTRTFTPVLSTTIYSFASILAVYLLATSIGSWLYRRDIRSRRVMDIPYLIAYLACFGFLPIIFNDPRFWVHLTRLEILGSIFPFCALLGYLTPRLVDDYSQGNPFGAGRAYTVNIIGCILGPLWAGYVLLPTFGVRMSLVILALPFVAIFVYFFKTIWVKNRLFAISTSILSFGLLIGTSNFFLSYEDGIFSQSGIVRRDYVATVIAYGKGMDKHLLVNGIGMTHLTPITKCMAHLPLAIRDKKPSSCLVICLGMGTTFRSAVSWGIDSTAIELVPSVRDVFGFFFKDAEEILNRPNAKIIIDDGRRFLKRTTERFDVITIDPPPPISSSGSGLLYSEEFYKILKNRLKENGILQQWFPGGEKATLQAVAMAIKREFPYVRVFNSMEGWGFHFFASLQPFEMPSVNDFVRRLPETAIEDLIEWNKDRGPAKIYQEVIEKEVPLKKILTQDATFSITDDRPFNEYFLLRRLRLRLLI